MSHIVPDYSTLDLPAPDRWIEGYEPIPVWNSTIFGDIAAYDEGINTDEEFIDCHAGLVEHAGLVLLAAARHMRETKGEGE